MISPGLRVPQERGEEVRRALRGAGVLRTDLEVGHEESVVVFPLVDGLPIPQGWGEPCSFDFRPRRTELPLEYRELLGVSREERERFPRSFDVVGDIVLIRLPDDLVDRRGEVGEALLRFVPGARIVGLDRGVQGPERRRSIQKIAGTGGWRTRHRENGLELDVDVERAYFSPRLAREHERVAAEVLTGDRVYDLCCGVGPFASTIARDARASTVTAVDANPAAIELLRATLARYAFGHRVVAREARLESFLPSAEPRERVVFNLPLEGIKYLPSVAPTVAPRGRLYYYEVSSREDLDERTEVVVRSLGNGGDWTVVDRRRVHPYSPTSDLVAYVLERGAP